MTETPYPFVASIEVEKPESEPGVISSYSSPIDIEWVSEHPEGDLVDEAGKEIVRTYGTDVEVDVRFHSDGYSILEESIGPDDYPGLYRSQGAQIRGAADRVDDARMDLDYGDLDLGSTYLNDILGDINGILQDVEGHLRTLALLADVSERVEVHDGDVEEYLAEEFDIDEAETIETVDELLERTGHDTPKELAEDVLEDES